MTSYLIEDADRANCPPSINRQAIAADLAPLLGGTVEITNAEDAPATQGVAIAIGNLRIYLHANYSTGARRVEARAYASRELTQDMGTGGLTHLPVCTFDVTRPIGAIASQIKRAVIDASASPLAVIEKMAMDHEQRRADLAAVMLALQTDFPALGLRLRNPGDTQAYITAHTANGYLNARLNADGSIYVDNLSSLRPHVMRALLAALFSPS